MKKIIERLKSPVVLIQLVTIIGAAVVLLAPGTDKLVDTIVVAVSTIVNAFAGLNNPTDSNNF